MKVILITKFAKLGNIGSIVNVKDGYAKNFLIPQKKAIFYSPENYKVFEAKKHVFEAESQKNATQASDAQGKLAGKNIIIIENASDDGRLYGSVNTGTIADQINKLVGSKLVSRINILLKKPIKELGVYDVKVNFYSDIFSDIKVIVTRSESEIENLLAAYNAAEVKAAEAKKKSKSEKAEEAKAEVVKEEAVEA